MKFTIELRTTISPTPYFFRRVHFMAASLRALGGILADHEIVVSVGGGQAGENYYRSQSWSNRYPIVWRAVPVDAFARLGYRATNRDRAAHMSRADYVMMVDADVIFLRDFSELLAGLRESPAICGVMAHGSPFLAPPPLNPDLASRIGPAGAPPVGYWELLAEHYGIAELPLDYQYSGWGIRCNDPLHRYAPAYFNGGMVIGPSDLMDAMTARYEEAESAVDRTMETYFRPQLARTLAIYKAGIPRRVLPVRYNFPNDPLFDAAYPDELPRIAILHYLRRTIVHRDRDFDAPAALAGLIARTDLVGTNELLRRRVAELYHTVVEEEQAAGLR